MAALRRERPRWPIGTKRLPLDTNYYATFNRPNVTLVDLKRTPVEELTATGIRTSAGHHEVDVIARRGRQTWPYGAA